MLTLVLQDHLLAKGQISPSNSKVRSESQSRGYKADKPVDSHEAAALSMELLLGSLQEGRLRIQRPIAVRFELEGDHYVAEAVDLAEFGFGKTASESLRDLQRAIAELYYSLEQDSHRLGADLADTWRRIQDYIVKTNPTQDEASGI
jgi:hypothetical protein